ncbi:MAG: type IV secretion system DNA-binding domain-containing protein [Candidatus Parcubacteria bacterium]|nr:type IV secretion system DNA-binding domain-containing protein [Candidatus Parcubacteria bacterium]
MPQANRVQIIKYAPPPPELPVFGKVKPEDVSFIGRTNYVASLEEKKFIFGVKRVDRRRHMYIIGKSGVGKTKLLELFIRQDVSYNHGLCLIDPHGDVIEAMLDYIPQERIEDVCIIDPADIDFPASFNPLANVDPMFKFQLTQGLIEVFQKQFGANWTPRLEHVFRFTCLALLDYPHATMRGMISMLTDRNYRQKVVEYITDDMVKRFFAIEFADWSEKFDTDAIIPLVNKLGQFLSDPLLRNIFGQKQNKIDISKLMNEEKIILINLSKGRLGEENSSFLGSIFLTKIKQAGMERAGMLEKDRKDFYLYVDEFQNVVTQTFENILSEARKYGLNLTIAHQYVGQIIPKVYQAVLGNVGSVISFRVGGEDAVKLKPEFSPVFDVKDMINLAVTEFYIKMTIDGESYDPFSAETLRVLPPTHPSYRQEIIDASHRKYSIPKGDAQRLIEEEEATIIRSTEEKAIIEGKTKKRKNTDEEDIEEEQERATGVETNSARGRQEAEPMI